MFIALPYVFDFTNIGIDYCFDFLEDFVQENFILLFMWSILIDQNCMKQQMFLCLMLLLIRLSTSASFCSPICGSGCNGDGSTNCNNRCWSDGAWSVSGSNTCVPRSSSNWAYFDTTSDLGGTLTLAGSTTTLSCGKTYFMSSSANGPITVSTVAAGITVPYYQLKWYVGVISVDVKCSGGGGGGGGGCGGSPTWLWTQTTQYTITFSDGSVTATPAIKIDTSAVTKQYKCSTDKYREYYFRASTLYNYNIMNTQLSWTIANDQATSQQWGIRQFIIIIRSCHPACTECFGPLATQCTVCASTPVNYWLSKNTCNETCLTKFGYGNPYTCIYCNQTCTTCYMDPLNCSACTISGIWASYLRADSATTTTCVQTCEPKQFANKTTRTCDPCDNVCATCVNRASYCTSCQFGFYWTGWYCYSPCPDQYFLESNNTNCTRCNPYCSVCVGNSTACTACTVSGQFKAFLHMDLGATTGTCVRVCNETYYGDTNNGTGPNVCMPCNTTCQMCTGFPEPCTKCIAGYYLAQTYCSNTCPNGTIAYNRSATEGVCLNCEIYCVGLTINMYFPDITNSVLYIDMLFSGELNTVTLDKTTFQTISISAKNIQYTIDMFTVTYVDLSTSAYRIILEPKTYIFLYNATFTVQTKAQPSPIDYSLGGLPFKTSNYLKTASATWFLIRGPPFSGLQLSIMNAVSNLSTNINNAFAKPYFQQIKKTGVFNLLFSGAQITSCSMLSNQIQSQNLYEGVRMWAVFVFFDAPAYEKISNSTKRFVSPTVEDIIRDAQQISDIEDQSRRLFSTDTMFWRFQRTGQTSFFIYDVYLPLFLIVTCWIGLIIAHFSQEKKWFASYGSNLYSAVHKIHEISLMYITMAAIVEFIYFKPTSLERIISAIICIIFNVYFAFYELYIYYDMMKYPMAEIGNKLYEYYVVRYGYFLKSVRFEEYDINQEWSPRHWLRPYNYHILSYYKKFLMMISLPLLYDTSYAQMVTLSLIQLVELIRFIKTWPFYSNFRNYFRLSLQISLLLFFIINIIQIDILQSIMSASSEALSQLTKIFYNLGWAGFALCFYFNISYVLICVYDLCVGLRQSNRSKMDRIRKKYYYNKIQEYEKENQSAPKQLVSKWVKLGNLNNKDYGELPEVNIRIQLYEFRKIGANFDFTMKRISSLKMKQKTKLRDPNNTTVGGKIQKKFVLSQVQNPRLYQIINEIYKRYEGPHVETLRLKTFINIWQKDYKQGQNIPFNRSMMFQKLELFSFEGQAKVHRLQNLLPGFPIEESIIFNQV